MAEADTAPPQTRLASGGGGDVSARLQQVLALLFPSNLAAKAALFAVVVALLPLLPASQAPRIWELPHLLLLGIIISYGIFGQKNPDAEVAAVAANKPLDDESAEAYVSQMMQGSLVFEDNGGRDRDDDIDGAKDGSGVQAWSSQYLPDDPLVVVADGGSSAGKGDASEKPLLLPVRKLKPPPAAEESATIAGDISDGIGDEEEFLAPKAGNNGVREHHAIPSPISVLDADLTLSPSSPPLLPPPPPPPPPPFLGRGRSLRKAKARSFNEFGAGSRRLGLQSVGNKFWSKSAAQAMGSTFDGYDPTVPFDDEADGGGQVDEMAAASDSSFSSDMVTDGDEENDKEDSRYGDDDGEELFELATTPRPEAEAETEDEVDRKADEFIAKFREQIRMQRVEPAQR